MTRLIAIIASVAVVVLLAGSLWFVLVPRVDADDPFAACRSSAVAGGAGTIGGPFTLVREDGATVTEAEVFTRPSILYFGYTFCPDVCPTDSARNVEAMIQLQEAGYDAQTVFISIDPERDTPEVMVDFTDLFHEDMVGLTGSPEQVKAASQAYKTYYAKQEGDPEYYLVDHSVYTYLILPEIGFVEFFKRDHSPAEIAQTAACFIDAAQP